MVFLYLFPNFQPQRWVYDYRPTWFISSRCWTLQKKQGAGMRAGNNNTLETDTFLSKEKEALGVYR